MHHQFSARRAIRWAVRIPIAKEQIAGHEPTTRVSLQVPPGKDQHAIIQQDRAIQRPHKRLLLEHKLPALVARGAAAIN